MAQGDDARVPLLGSDELEENQDDILQDDVEVEFVLTSPPREIGPGADKRPTRTGSSLLKVRKKHYSGNEMIVAIFVVAFDTKKGKDFRDINLGISVSIHMQPLWVCDAIVLCIYYLSTSPKL